MLPVFDHKIILSGTPSPNSLMNLWSQYYLLDHGEALYESYYRFRNKFFHQLDHNGFKWGLNPGADKEIYERIAPRTFRLDAADYLEMPDLIRNSVICELPKATLSQYKKLEDEFFMEFDEGRVEAFNAASLSSKLRQFIQGGLYHEDTPGTDRMYQPIHMVKLDALRDLMDAHTDEPILCAIQFKFELQILRKAFPEAPAIVGGTHANESTRYIEQWNKGEIPLLICHPASLSHSVNLQTGGHIVLWYGLPWSLEHYQQLNARLYRQGQQHAVVIHHLVMQDTVDEAIMKALDTKDKGQRALLNYLREYKHERSF
jgi:SNF2 family DNA or RNA helicase